MHPSRIDGRFLESEWQRMGRAKTFWVTTFWVTTALVLGLLDSAAQAEHWNQFRGPRGDGKAEERSLVVSWSEQEAVTWKTPIPGNAWSSPVVWEDRIWVSSATEEGDELYALEIDAHTGDVLRNLTVFEIEEPMFCYPYNSYASPTPVIEQGRLWVHYGSAGTACIDTDSGEILWTRQDLPCDHHRGPGSSPIVFEDLLIVHFDGFDLQYVVALDKETGRTVWKQDRAIDYGTDNGDAKKAYSTPSVIEHEGRLQLISPAAVATEAFDPRTGDRLWTVYHGGFNAAARPLYSHGMVFICTEAGKRLVAVRPDGSGDVTESHLVWNSMKSTPTRPSPLIVGDYLYMVSDTGVVSCLDIETGETRWAERVEGRHSASPIYADGRIYMFDEEGVSHVVVANPDRFELLAKNELEAGCMASPAVHGEALIVRTKTDLYRLE